MADDEVPIWEAFGTSPASKPTRNTSSTTSLSSSPSLTANGSPRRPFGAGPPKPAPPNSVEDLIPIYEEEQSLNTVFGSPSSKSRYNTTTATSSTTKGASATTPVVGGRSPRASTMSYGSTSTLSYSANEILAIQSSSTSLDDFLPSRRSKAGAAKAPAQPPPPQATGDYISHEVKSTDTLVGLGLRYGTKAEDIKRANSIYSDVELIGRKVVTIPVSKATLEKFTKLKTQQNEQIKASQQEMVAKFAKTMNCEPSLAQYYLEQFRWSYQPAIRRYEMDCADQQSLATTATTGVPTGRSVNVPVEDDFVDLFSIGESPKPNNHDIILFGDDPNLKKMSSRRQQQLQDQNDSLFNL